MTSVLLKIIELIIITFLLRPHQCNFLDFLKTSRNKLEWASDFIPVIMILKLIFCSRFHNCFYSMMMGTLLNFVLMQNRQKHCCGFTERKKIYLSWLKSQSKFGIWLNKGSTQIGCMAMNLTIGLYRHEYEIPVSI